MSRWRVRATNLAAFSSFWGRYVKLIDEPYTFVNLPRQFFVFLLSGLIGEKKCARFRVFTPLSQLLLSEIDHGQIQVTKAAFQ